MSVKAVDSDPTQLECTAKIQQLEQKITQITQEVAAVKSCACSSSGTKEHTLIKPVPSKSITSNGPGKGTSQDPYKIANIQDLQKLRSIWKNNRGKYFIVTQNIDLSSIANFAPLPPFEGTLYGNNRKILHLKIDGTHLSSQGNKGLFTTIGRTGLVKNLRLENVLVKGAKNVGGLAGELSGRIDNSYVTGQVSGTDSYVGGLVGSSDGGSRITDSYATTNVSGTSNVGGLVGDIFEGTIQGSYATGTVSGIGILIGGLVGDFLGIIQSSYATGSVSGKYYIGGLVGLVRSDRKTFHITSIKINNSYATGSVSGRAIVGGLTGDNRATIANCYAIGQVISGRLDRVGGLVGKNSYRIENSYGKQQIRATNTIGAKTDTELKTPSTFTGWDTRIWKLTQNQYPKLKRLN